MLWRAPWLRGRSKMLLYAAWDVVCLWILYILNYRIRMGTWETLGNSVLVIPVLWIACSYLFGRYSRSEENEFSFWFDIQKCALVSAVVCSFLILHTWAYGIGDAGTRLRGFIVPLFVSMSLVSSTTRQIMLSKTKGSVVETFIVCSELERNAVVSLSEFKKKLGCIGFIEESELKKSLPDLESGRAQVVVSTRILRSEELREKLFRLRSKGVRLLSLVDWCERYLHQVPPECIDFEWLAVDEGFAIQPGRIGWRIKRLIDVLASTALFITTLPLQLAACVLIKLEDAGPIFYVQKRSGLYSKEIRVLKFRSMCVGSESNGAVWSKKGDKRVTRVGAVLRRFRIDELPQLLSVIIGELSLIGPRPERPELEVELRKVLNNYDVRYWIRPGLTGWAQVSYPYGASIEDSRQKLSYDLFYVKNAGILMDALITIKTIRLLAYGKGSVAKESLLNGGVES